MRVLGSNLAETFTHRQPGQSYLETSVVLNHITQGWCVSLNWLTCRLHFSTPVLAFDLNPYVMWTLGRTCWTACLAGPSENKNRQNKLLAVKLLQHLLLFKKNIWKFVTIISIPSLKRNSSKKWDLRTFNSFSENLLKHVSTICNLYSMHVLSPLWEQVNTYKPRTCTLPHLFLPLPLSPSDPPSIPSFLSSPLLPSLPPFLSPSLFLFPCQSWNRISVFKTISKYCIKCLSSVGNLANSHADKPWRQELHARSDV